MTDSAGMEFQKLVDIIAKLRSPEGCPWDRKQTHSSLREYLLEECYEALEALDENDNQKLAAELGDILLQIMLHSQIGCEKGEFDIGDVIRGINEKLIRRHPHVFADVQVKDAEEVTKNWEAIKKTERNNQKSMLDSVPKQMPALAYSQDIQRRAAQIGFDWENIDGVIDKLCEEVGEFKAATSIEDKTEEFGDLFFTLVNIARRLGIESESALRNANRKFYSRFSHMERLCNESGQDLGKLSFDAQNQLWNESKQALKNTGDF